MKKITALLLMVMTCVAGCRKDKEIVMNPNAEIKTLTHCIGRHYVNIPDSFVESSLATGIFKESNYGRQAQSIDVAVSTSKVSKSEYLKKKNSRENELRMLSGEVFDKLQMVRGVSNDLAIFRIQRMDDAYISEVSALHEASMVTARLASFGNQFEKAEERLINFVSRLKLNKRIGGGKISGFCLGRLVLAGDFEREEGEYSFSDKGGIRVSFKIETFTRNEAVDLLARVSGPKSLLTIFKVEHKVLRARELEVAGMRAQEWLSSAILQDESDVQTHTFELQTKRPTPGKLEPLISVTLTTAQPQGNGMYPEKSTPDKEAIALWDGIVNSIRLSED